MEISFDCLENTSTIVLHAKEIEISGAEVYEDTEDLDYWASAIKVEFNEVYETVTLTLDDALLAGKKYMLYIQSFNGTLNDALDGFYRSSYKTANGETR